MLLGFLIGATAFTIGGIWAKGAVCIVLSVLVMLCEAPSFPMNFEMATAHFGKWQPTAETAMILSISGGGVQPLLMGKLADKVGVSKAWGLTPVDVLRW